MKSWLRPLASFSILLFLVGCASGPKFSDLSPTLGNATSEQARVYVYRKSVLGAAIQPMVKINGEDVGKAVPKGFFFVDLEPGKYKIATTTEVDRHLSLVLERGQTRYVRLNISMGFFVGHVYPELVESETGKEEIQSLSFTGESK